MQVFVTRKYEKAWHACIMCFAVLSSLLNLMWGTTSGMAPSCETDSLVCPVVVMYLTIKLGPTVLR